MSNGLDVRLQKEPFKWSPENGDRHTDIALSTDEWGSFIFRTLNAPELKHTSGESIGETDERREIAFKTSLKDFPLLARISDFYWGASFEPFEIPLLKAELQRSSLLTLDDDAKAFLDGLLKACAEAESANLGISLSGP